MKFKLKSCRIGDEDNFWFEEYTENIDDPEKWGKDIIDYFNNTLRPGEEPRKYLGVEILDKNELKHTWEKISLVTEGSYDRYECSNCGVTGKRYGLSSVIIRDGKYEADKYKTCIPSKNKLSSKGDS